jgi:hypothetical protein
MKQFASHEPGSQLLFTLKGINDFAEKETGVVSIKLIDDQGKVVWEQSQSIEIDGFGDKNFPVILNLPEKPGGYVLVTEFEGKLSPVKKQISRRYLKVGNVEHRYYELNP